MGGWPGVGGRGIRERRKERKRERGGALISTTGARAKARQSDSCPESGCKAAAGRAVASERGTEGRQKGGGTEEGREVSGVGWGLKTVVGGSTTPPSLNTSPPGSKAVWGGVSMATFSRGHTRPE